MPPIDLPPPGILEDPPVDFADPSGRAIRYARLSVTDRCNLRCRYCMPGGGVPFLPGERILSWDEMLRLVRVLRRLGVTKVRITGGEPTCRRGLVDFIAEAKRGIGIPEIHITTNGVGLRPLVSALEKAGLDGVNLSIDTLDPVRFETLTGRDALREAIASLDALRSSSIPVKVNTVVLSGMNTDELPGIASLARRDPIDVRFIEKMDLYRTKDAGPRAVRADAIEMLLRRNFPDMEELPATGGTAKLFRVGGFRGRLGIIAAYSRPFCTHCDRIRITADGRLKTCLYGDAGLDLRSLLRRGSSDREIARALRKAVGEKEPDGQAAQRSRAGSGVLPMSSIGG